MDSGERLADQRGLNERLVIDHDLTLPESHPLYTLLKKLQYYPEPEDLEDPNEVSEFRYTRGFKVWEMHLLFFENEVLYRPLEPEFHMLLAISEMVTEELLDPFVLIVTDNDLVPDSRVTSKFLNSRKNCRVGFVSLNEAKRLLSKRNSEKALHNALKRMSECDPKPPKPPKPPEPPETPRPGTARTDSAGDL
jgi:hypothetical protein